MLESYNRIFVIIGVCRSLQAQNQLEFSTVEFNLFQNESGIRLVGFYDIIRVANHFREETSEEFKIIRVPLLDVSDLFVGYDDFVAGNVRRDDAVKFPVELADEVHHAHPKQTISGAGTPVKKKIFL